MLHWVPALPQAFVGARADEAKSLDQTADRCVENLRATHALMLAYAAQRRRAAQDPVDSHYWKAAERHALGKAEALRVGGGLKRLP